ncbi:MAG: hypothetical protein K9G34_09310, partial [Melioribacteraceae bacterium]|nr:hypothetical protein [Melioribacteraceae bacterium]
MKKKQKEEISIKRESLSKSKKILFWIFLTIFPLLILASIEIVLHLFNYDGSPKLFVSTPTEESKYFGINVDIGKRYFNSNAFVPTPRKDLFLKEKPENGYRLFVLGGSTAAGYPYGNNITFPRILNRKLNDVFPEKHIEVINVAMTAINSYSLLDFIDEINEQEPDAILIYAGHNEFYGALGVSSMENLGRNRFFVKTILQLQKFKTFILLRKISKSIFGLFGSKEKINGSEVMNETAMSAIVRDKEIALNSEIYDLGNEQFRSNLIEIVERFQNAGVKILLSELVSNIKDQPPFESVNSDTNVVAGEVFKKAKKCEDDGEYLTARNLFNSAKDLDALRFRASDDFNKIVHEIGNFYNIPTVPLVSIFERNSPNELTGDNLMLDHLHPNIDGYFLMADGFFEQMRLNKFIVDKWPEQRIKPNHYYYTNWGVTEFDSVYAYLNILQLKGGWPFKKTGSNVALKNFQPKTLVDSFAHDVTYLKKFTPEIAHIKLAKMFESEGQYKKSFMEHRALIYTVPQLDIFYEPMIELFLKTNQYQTAFAILSEAVHFNDSPFICKWLGQFSLALDFTENGIFYLEKSLADNPKDIDVLFNLTR